MQSSHDPQAVAKKLAFFNIGSEDLARFPESRIRN